MSILKRLFVLLALALATPAFASDDPRMDADVAHINSEWARIHYRVPEGQQYAQYTQLAQQAAEVVQRYPHRADPLMWQGIVTSELAAHASTLRRLGFATQARDILLRARQLDRNAGQGGVAMSLGVLYYKVPGWPIGFGSAERARGFLQSALAISPNGLDTNFFWADFLESQGDHAGARAAAQRALHAPHDPSRAVWDEGRRAEVQALLRRIR